MACVISVEATFLGLRAARFNLDEITTRRGYGRPQVEAFEGEFWGTGSDEVTLGSIAKSDKLLQRIAAIIQRVALGSEQDVIGVAISFSAAVRSDGMVHLSHEGEYIQIRVRRELQDKLSELWQHPVDVSVDNRSNMGAWGEYLVGQGAVMRANSVNPVHTIYITVSGNIGVGIITDGKLYTGLKGYAGEMGHLIINPASDRQCPACLQKGCASEVASGRALVHDVQQSASAGGATACVTSLATATAAADAARYDPGYFGTVQEGRTTHRIDARSILRASQSGTCQIADQAVDNMVTNLARLVEEITYIFDPHLIVLGAIASWVPNLEDKVVKRMNVRLYVREGHELLTSDLGDQAALYGSAIWIHDKLKGLGQRTIPTGGPALQSGGSASQS